MVAAGVELGAGWSERAFERKEASGISVDGMCEIKFPSFSKMRNESYISH